MNKKYSSKHTQTIDSHSRKKGKSKTIRNQIISNKILDKHIVNIDDDNNDNEEKNSSFDRRCILFELASDVERNASKGLRVLSEKKKKMSNRSNEILIEIIKTKELCYDMCERKKENNSHENEQQFRSSFFFYRDLLKRVTYQQP
jgi:hypothetical protein